MSIRRDCAGRTAAIKDLHSSREEERNLDTEKQKGRDRQREARNSSHACLPKRTTLSYKRGRGEPAQTEGSRVGAGVAAKGFFSLLQLAQQPVLFFHLNLKKTV